MQITSFRLPRFVRSASADTDDLACSERRNDAGNGVTANTELTEEEVREIGRRAGRQLRALIRTGRARHAG